MCFMEKEPKMLKSPEKVYLLAPLTFSQEQRKINDDMANARDEFDGLLKKTENFPGEKWNSLEDRRKEIYNAGINLVKKIKKIIPEENELFDCALITLKVAENLLITGTFEKQAEIASRFKLGDSYNKIGQALRFNACGELFIKIDKISLADIFRKKDFDSSQYLKSSITAALVNGNRFREDFEVIFTENTVDPMAKSYPKTAKKTIYDACLQLSILSVMDAETFDFSKIPADNKMEKEMVLKAKKIVEEASSIRNDLLNTAFSPDSPDFPVLSKTLEKYLSENDPILRALSLARLDIHKIGIQVRAYRLAKSLAVENKNTRQSLFYSKLVDSIKKFSKDSPQQMKFFTMEECDIFLNKNKLKDSPTPSFEDIREINGKILKLPSKYYRYEINSANINSCNSVNIKTISIKLLSATKVTVILRGEESDFEIRINTKKKEIDWQFFDVPEEPEMEEIKKGLMCLIYSSLLEVRKNTEEEYKKLQALKDPKTEPQITPVPKQKREWIPREKVVKNKPKPMDVIETILQDKHLSEKGNEIKIQLRFPKGVKSVDLMETITEKGQKVILNKIRKLNIFGTSNEFSAITATHKGKTVHRLRARNYRVLATKKDSKNENGANNGKRLFEIFKIGRRGKVFGQRTKKIY